MGKLLTIYLNNETSTQLDECVELVRKLSPEEATTSRGVLSRRFIERGLERALQKYRQQLKAAG